MASATRLPLKSITFATAIALTAGASRVNVQHVLEKIFTGPGSYSRIAAAALLLANLKNVPFAWHYRVFNAILKHCLFSLPNIPKAVAPETLFLPVITSSHSPLCECDYNLHKSNSTYFSDLDVTRSHLVCALLQPGIDRLHHNRQEKLVMDPKTGEAAQGSWSIMLGGVMTSFKREIGMYQGYEMWSRVLCWDRKWIYIVTHFVKKGTVRPSSYILTDGSWFGGKGRYTTVKGEGKARKEGAEDVEEKAVFASAISKYVVKLGRLTVHPEVLMDCSGMLPPRPGGWASMSKPSGESTPEAMDMSIIENEEEAAAAAAAEPTADDAEEEESQWDWKRVEKENKRGLKYAEHLTSLDGLHQEFSGSKTAALGRYRDFIW